MIIFWISIVGANYPSNVLFSIFNKFGEVIKEFLIYINLPKFIYLPLMDGVYKVLTWVVAVMLPPMAIFFPLFTLLEDLGFLPRIAFNMDKYFKKAHAHGKQLVAGASGGRIGIKAQQALIQTQNTDVHQRGGGAHEGEGIGGFFRAENTRHDQRKAGDEKAQPRGDGVF